MAELLGREWQARAEKPGRCFHRLLQEPPKQAAQSLTPIQRQPCMDAIQEFTQSVLAPQLLTLGLNKHQRAIVLEDVAQRLESLLSHWSDLPFRRTILVLGTEEASFWEPRTASLEIRSLVVVTVRNSLVTDLNASRAYTPKLRARKHFLPDERIRADASKPIPSYAVP